MGLSKETRIKILLAVDGTFFLIELVAGLYSHSLALVADSFHMLNDVLSLFVGLWAVKVASSSSSNMYTYGWQRAETLGALINGVFLVALCLSIALEALQRFAEPQEVRNPVLVLIVGCMGLASNMVGLVVLHDHSHGHGGHNHSHGHSHSHADELDNTERGQPHAHNHATIARAGVDTSISVSPSRRTLSNGHTNGFTKSDEDDSYVAGSTSKLTHQATSSPSRRQTRAASHSHSRYSSIDNIPTHPASFRNDIIAASRLEGIDSGLSTESEGEADIPEGEEEDMATETSALLKHNQNGYSEQREQGKTASSGHKHSSHRHRQPKDANSKTGGGGHGHSHDLNMRGVFLHVMGDALGNLGVIGAALFIWLTPYEWRHYADPAVSMVITVIILFSALPLCRAASRILLQAVPVGMSIDDIKADIEDLEGVVSCHHFHVWQLSDTKLVASLHVQVAFAYDGAYSAQYMKLAKDIRTCLHEYGIHSSTVQPEFCLDDNHQHHMVFAPGADGADDEERPGISKRIGSRVGSIKSVPDACLLDCEDECGNGKSCCSPSKPADTNGSDHSH